MLSEDEMENHTFQLIDYTINRLYHKCVNNNDSGNENK